MTEYLDLSAVAPMTASPTFAQEVALQPTQELLGEVAATSHEGGTNPPLTPWHPTEPQFTKAIAHYYGVSRKSVQQWFQKVKDACPWFAEADLKLPDERYTPLCIQLMGSYRTSGLPFEAWKNQIWEQNPDLVSSYQTAQPQNQAATPTVTSAITIRASEVPLAVQDLQPLNLSVVDSTQQLANAISSLNSTLQQFVSNDQTLEAALRHNAVQKGSRLGTELAIAEIGSMMQATESARVELAKKLGLLDPPQQQSV